MNWLDVLTDWGFGIVVIRALIIFFVSFIIGYFVGSSHGYIQGIQDGAGMRKIAKSGTNRAAKALKAIGFDEFTVKRGQNAEKSGKIRL